MKKITVIFLILLMALVMIQCSKRENPVSPEIQHGLFWTVQFLSPAINDNIMSNVPTRKVLVYTPPGYDTAATSVGYPVLYLLHGYGGDQTYYKGLFGISSTLDEMINSGEIKPLIVVTPDGNNSLGGGFYTNSPAFGGRSFAGNMQDFITNEVVHMVDSVFNTIPDRAHRAIAGHSMGGYGAVKIAMLRNDLFSSASSMSGPLAMWGSEPQSDQFKGLLETSLIDRVFAENGGVRGDVATFNAITSGSGKRLTNMMFALAAAFSPHDPANPDHTYAHRFVSPTYEGYVDLPFDADGNVVMSVWAYWLGNDVTTLFAGSEALGIPSFAGVFDSTGLYLDAGSQDDLGLQYQTDVLHQVATMMGKANSFEIYNGSDMYPPNHTMLIGDRVAKVLKFHDQKFPQLTH